MKIKSLILLFFISFQANASNDVIIYKNLYSFLKDKTSKLDGKITVSIREVDLEKFNFFKCQQLDFFIPNGSKEVGQTTVGIRCLDKEATKPNSVVLQAEIIQEKKYLVVNRKMNVGEEIKEADIKEEVGDVSRFYFKYYQDPKDVIGKKVKNLMPEGQTIRDSNLALPVVIQYNQNVMVVDGVGNFRVTASGKAMSMAYEGQQVRVKMPSNKIILGVAQADGSVKLIQK
mgnify:CR=1 FL=1